MNEFKSVRPWIVAFLSLCPIIVCSISSANTPMKSTRFAACPDSPNCVSSLASDPAHKVNPITYSGSSQDAFKRFKAILLEMPGTRLVTGNKDYIHLEFHSRFLDFVDDVEAQLNVSENTIEIRSASRTGYWDFGANKKRVELIRKRFYGSDD